VSGFAPAQTTGSGLAAIAVNLVLGLASNNVPLGCQLTAALLLGGELGSDPPYISGAQQPGGSSQPSLDLRSSVALA
jgi:hypothetical protein